MKSNNNHAVHVCNLIAMALQDEDFDRSEKKIIIEILKKLEVDSLDIEKELKQGQIFFNSPLTLVDRIKYLHDLVMVMQSDGVIHDKETQYLSDFLNMYGFKDIYKGESIVLDVHGIIDSLSFKKFIQEYKMEIGVDLSTIEVDKDFNIEFPLYQSKLKNVGPLPKTLYVFFLLKDEFIDIAQLSSDSNKQILRRIYSMMPNSDFNAELRIGNLTNPDGISFNSIRSILNKAIRNAIPNENPDVVKNYLISGTRNQKKGIYLDRKLVHFHHRMTF